LMLSIQAVRGLPRLRAPGIVPCIISFSRQLPCFLQVSKWNDVRTRQRAEPGARVQPAQQRRPCRPLPHTFGLHTHKYAHSRLSSDGVQRSTHAGRESTRCMSVTASIRRTGSRPPSTTRSTRTFSSQLGQQHRHSRTDTGNESVPIQLAQCRFPELEISTDKILI